MKERSPFDKNQMDDPGANSSSSKSGGRSFSLVLQEIVKHVTEIIRSEVRLARTEVRKDVAQVAKASRFVAIGAILALYAVGFTLLGAVYALGTRMPPWAASLTVGVGIGVVAAIFLQVGRTRIKLASLKPEETIRSLRENVTWMKKQTK